MTSGISPIGIFKPYSPGLNSKAPRFGALLYYDESTSTRFSTKLVADLSPAKPLSVTVIPGFHLPFCRVDDEEILAEPARRHSFSRSGDGE